MTGSLLQQSALQFVAYGGPKTKGSLKPVPVGGRTRLIEDHKSSKPWRKP